MRTLGADAGWLDRFADSMACYFNGCILEHRYRMHKNSPSIEEYRRLRAWSIGTLPVFGVIELAQGDLLSRAEATWLPVVALVERAALLCAWVNDVYSYDKEAVDGDPNNLILVLANEYGLPLSAAFGAAAEVFNTDLENFGRERTELTLATTSETLHRYAEGLDDWVRGNFTWTGLSRRYGETALSSKRVSNYLSPVSAALPSVFGRS